MNDVQPVFQPCWPPWYIAEDDTINIEDPDSSISNDLLDLIIDLAFERLGSRFDNYEPRHNQVAMAKTILRSFMEEKICVLEASTGLGKSLAYMVAGLSYSYLTGTRLLITTETKNLQLQIFYKDIRTIQDILAPSLEYALCMGSGNYLCKLRYEATDNAGDFLDLVNQDVWKHFSQEVTNIFSDNAEGSIYDFTTEIPSTLWSMVNREPDGCPSKKCFHFTECNYFKTKHKWEKARVLITNHYLLLLHIQTEQKILPAYSCLVVDEAHSFLNTFHSIFTLHFSTQTLDDKKKLFDKHIAKNKLLEESKIDSFNQQWELVTRGWNVFLSYVADMMELVLDSKGTRTINQQVDYDITELCKNAHSCGSQLTSWAEKSEEPILLNSVNHITHFLNIFTQFLGTFSDMDFDRTAYWGESKEGILHLYVCYIQAGEHLTELFTVPQAWVSATLGYWHKQAVPPSKEVIIQEGYFQYFIENLFPQFDDTEDLFVKDIFKSSFRFRDNVILYLPKHLTPPLHGVANDDKLSYETNLWETIIDLVDLSQGDALVLFTSYYMLNKANDILSNTIDLPISSQGALGAQKAMEKFMATPHSVLLGTQSFWQGVDIPGSKLKMLIITKLMFPPPDEPLFQARSKRLENFKRRPFNELSLPYANTMLRQGFGRLVRTRTDKGVIAILDSRITQKFYGNILLSNLPRTDRVYDYKHLTDSIKKGAIFNSN